MEAAEDAALTHRVRNVRRELEHLVDSLGDTATPRSFREASPKFAVKESGRVDYDRMRSEMRQLSQKVAESRTRDETLRADIARYRAELLETQEPQNDTGRRLQEDYDEDEEDEEVAQCTAPIISPSKVDALSDSREPSEILFPRALLASENGSAGRTSRATESMSSEIEGLAQVLLEKADVEHQLAHLKRELAQTSLEHARSMPRTRPLPADTKGLEETIKKLQAEKAHIDAERRALLGKVHRLTQKCKISDAKLAQRQNARSSTRRESRMPTPAEYEALRTERALLQDRLRLLEVLFQQSSGGGVVDTTKLVEQTLQDMEMRRELIDRVVRLSRIVDDLTDHFNLPGRARDLVAADDDSHSGKHTVVSEIDHQIERIEIAFQELVETTGDSTKHAQIRQHRQQIEELTQALDLAKDTLHRQSRSHSAIERSLVDDLQIRTLEQQELISRTLLSAREFSQRWVTLGNLCHSMAAIPGVAVSKIEKLRQVQQHEEMDRERLEWYEWEQRNALHQQEQIERVISASAPMGTVLDRQETEERVNLTNLEASVLEALMQSELNERRMVLTIEAERPDEEDLEPEPIAEPSAPPAEDPAEEETTSSAEVSPMWQEGATAAGNREPSPPPAGTLRVTVEKGSQLGDPAQHPDAFVVLQLGSTRKQTTSVSQSRNPIWNEEFMLEVIDPSGVLIVEVWERATFASLGKASVTLVDLPRGVPQKIMLPMDHSGKLFMTLEAFHFGEPPKVFTIGEQQILSGRESRASTPRTPGTTPRGINGRSYFGIEVSDGIILRDVDNTSETHLEYGGMKVMACRGPAVYAGIRIGDLIQQVNGTAVTNLKEFASALMDLPQGAPVAFQITREGASRTIKLFPSQKYTDWQPGARHTEKIRITNLEKVAGGESAPPQYSAPPTAPAPPPYNGLSEVAAKHMATTFTPRTGHRSLSPSVSMSRTMVAKSPTAAQARRPERSSHAPSPRLGYVRPATEELSTSGRAYSGRKTPTRSPVPRATQVESGQAPSTAATAVRVPHLRLDSLQPKPDLASASNSQRDRSAFRAADSPRLASLRSTSALSK
eukprot:TRINITY_DN6605_c0_g1_i1.p1 TRINITY_DN6605_c0_g1~~TRINITY_DN6605_c0_g1_i1.p1  ORF type:complete len:1068 (-),score=132.43 TRINITY_DN6605_c0_g1_i1:111-3314(-)